VGDGSIDKEEAQLEKWVMLTHSVDLMSLKAKRKNSTPMYKMYFSYFSKHLRRLNFCYDHINAKCIDIDTMITSVAFTVNVGACVSILNLEGPQCLDDFMTSKNGDEI
jgi:hypothetical protein